MIDPFGGLFGPEAKLATSVDAYLDRLKKVLEVRLLLDKVDNKAVLTEYDEAISAIIKHMTAALEEAQAAKEEADKIKAEAEEQK